MKMFMVLLVLLPTLVCPLTAPAQQLVADTEAAQHVGQQVTITGKVAQVFVSKNGNTFLNFGGAYPNQTFTGFIPLDARGTVGDVSALAHKVVTITGQVRIYKGKPEIVVTSRAQIKEA